MVHAINPMAVARYRDRHSMARKKSDHVDAMTLVNVMRIDGPHEIAAPRQRSHADDHGARPRCPGRDLAADQGNQELRALPREYCGLPQRIRRHRSYKPRHGGRPRDTRDRTDTCTECAIDQLPGSSPLFGGLVGNVDSTRPQSESIRRCADRSRANRHLVEYAMGSQVSALLATLNTECVNADNFNESAAEAFRNHPDYVVITSFPGLGEATGARVLAEIGDDRGRFADVRRLKSFAGSAPATRAPGRCIPITHRHVKNTRLAAVGFVRVRRHPETWARSKDHCDRRRTVTGTPRRGATSSTGSWASSTNVYRPARPTTSRGRSCRCRHTATGGGLTLKLIGGLSAVHRCGESTPEH